MIRTMHFLWRSVNYSPATTGKMRARDTRICGFSKEFV